MKRSCIFSSASEKLFYGSSPCKRRKSELSEEEKSERAQNWNDFRLKYQEQLNSNALQAKFQLKAKSAKPLQKESETLASEDGENKSQAGSTVSDEEGVDVLRPRKRKARESSHNDELLHELESKRKLIAVMLPTVEKKVKPKKSNLQKLQRQYYAPYLTKRYNKLANGRSTTSTPKTVKSSSFIAKDLVPSRSIKLI